MNIIIEFIEIDEDEAMFSTEMEIEDEDEDELDETHRKE